MQKKKKEPKNSGGRKNRQTQYSIKKPQNNQGREKGNKRTV